MARAGDIEKTAAVKGPPGRKVRSIYRSGLMAAALACCLLGLVELGLGLCGVTPVLYQEDPYVGFSSRMPLFVEQTGPGGAAVMVTAENKRNLFNSQRFPLEKPPNTYRIFCLGGSTTYGRPYDDAVSYCGWLRATLPKADPSRTWEVINAGGISYASYRVTQLMTELVRYDPDLFIVYTGHNEFLEERTYRSILAMPGPLRELGASFRQTRLFAVVGRVAGELGSKDGAEDDKRYFLPGEVDAMLDHSVGPEAYHRDDDLRRHTIEHFELNLRRTIDIARAANIDLILVSPASNLLDCTPFKSEHIQKLSESDRTRWENLYRDAEHAHTSGRLQEALTHADQALALDGRHAHLHYLRGRTLWNLGRYADARAAFMTARDEDVCPLRALTPMGRIIADVANERAVPLVDYAGLVEGQSPHGVPGNNLFLDHVHPTVEGHRLLSFALLDEMALLGLVRPAGTWDDQAIASVREEVEGRLDPKAQGVALRNLAKVFGWAGKFEEARNLALRAVELSPDDAEAHHQAGQNAARLGLTDEAIRHYREAVRIQPSHGLARLKLGNALSARGESDEAAGHYRALLELGPEFATLAHNNLGNELAAQGRHEKAVEHYRKALALRPAYGEAHGNLGLALSAMGRDAEAIDHYRAALQQDPENAAAHYNLGLSLAEENERQNAIRHFRHAVRLMPDYAPAHYHLGDVLWTMGRDEEALRHLREATRLQSNYAKALGRTAWILATSEESRLRDTAQALRLAERAVELTNGQDPDCLRSLAAACAAAGQSDRAAALEDAASRIAAPQGR